MDLKRWSGAILLLTILGAGLPAQEETDASGASTSLGLGVGFSVVSFPDPGTEEVLTYQQLALQPTLNAGRFGVGLDLRLNYRFTAGDGSEFEVREEDWIPPAGMNALELYLPKVDFLRWAQKGDPLFIHLGGFTDASLGNGFILQGYSNRLFLPERRIFGGTVDVDGALLDFPYVGIETLVANVAAWDVIAGRLYARPLAGTGIPVFSGLQLGGTLALDMDPFYHARIKRDALEDADDDWTEADFLDGRDISRPDDPIVIWGGDVRLPILDMDVLSLAAFGDVVRQEDRTGGMVGTGGRLLRFILYGAQLRLYEDNFVPTFFDRSYDLRRVERYAVYQEEEEVRGGFGWLGELGFSVLADSLVFLTTFAGPLGPDNDSTPELTSTLTLAEGTIPGLDGFSFQGRYEAFNLSKPEDLIDLEDAIIGARFSIRSGPVVVSLNYDLVHDPYAEDDPWVVTSGLETTIAF